MKYNSGKNSELIWTGEIPSHWEAKRVKDLGQILNGYAFSKYDFKTQGVRVLKIANIQHMKIDFSEESFVGEHLYDSLAQFRIHDGDVVFALTRPIISTGIKAAIVHSEEKLLLNQRNAVFRASKKVNKKWFYYLLLSNSFIEIFDNYIDKTGTQPNISATKIGWINCQYPTLSEQSLIANYLEIKIQAIDKKVSLLVKKTGYYQELRKCLINEAVTTGLEKHLDVEKNELGFNTPKKWIKCRLKDLGFLFSGLSGKSGDDFNQEDNLNNKGFIPFTNIANNTYLKRDHLGTVVVYEGEKQNKVRKGDIFFLMSSEGYEDIGKTAVLAEDIEETYLNSFCKGYRVNPRKCNPFFLNYLMLSDYYRQLLIVEGKGFTRINLKMEKVNDFLVFIPNTLKAQEDIVKLLDAKLDTIAKIVSNIQSQIIALKELRKTLINDVVTGKIKVIND